ncbi:DUF4194 domain-containing protein [Glutamicibacter sp. NPDC087344]|uniref:DUF4194 domain-containing protein n=1 Tax=Glutamicibacter sp. NPDC087344 TaxID=3363994 RepID=UPI003809D1FA
MSEPTFTTAGIEDTANRDARLWPEDTGELSAASRKVLVQLVKGPYVSAERHSEAWRVLLTDTTALRSRLADMFLDLVLDETQGVAFVRNASLEAGAPQVVRTMALTFLDTAMLLYLRRELLRGSNTQRVFVGRDEVFDHLNSYRSAESTDEAGFLKRVSSAWTKMLKHSLLLSSSVPDRFEVSPILRLIFSPEQIRAVEDEYRRLARQDKFDDVETEEDQ